jgi:hypothetical protein
MFHEAPKKKVMVHSNTWWTILEMWDDSLSLELATQFSFDFHKSMLAPQDDLKT